MLTKREVQILRMISHGYTVKEISSMLFVSDHTIITHKRNMLTKLEINNSPRLVRKGFELGLLKIENAITS